ncbi:DUF5602 domain-containing protein [Bdellovibrio bacteriovorus]|uniref:DUF5602 domain-containing protein n=1 Tax=Bdellovibrio bacteriovorus TaxID=959 RepID=UPI0035A7144F
MRGIFVFCGLFFLAIYAHGFIVYGDAVAMGEGTAKAFADIGEDGTPYSVGLALTDGALNALPQHEPGEYTLKLPSILNIPPYNHMVINWMPHGHEPDGIYNRPHFDFHFYFIDEATRKAITCMGADREICLKQPDPDKLPPFYVGGPEGVPQMGWHWVDMRSPEYNGKPFTTTYIYGYYDANLIFIEPMITREFLLKKKKFEQELMLPKTFTHLGYYPQKYSIHFDKTRAMHFITLKYLKEMQ